MENKVAIHQPNYLPWIGFFNKMKLSDIFVLMDNVDYTRNSIMNRNKIKTPNGFCYLTIPIGRGWYKTPFYQVMLPSNEKWKQDHLKSIRFNYKKSDYFESYISSIEGIYNNKNTTLCELNEKIIKFLAKEFKINTKIVKATNLKINDRLRKTDLLLDILEKVNATTYISGMGSKMYMEPKKFNKIQVVWQEFKIMPYKQLWEKFQPDLSAIDLLLNMGEKSEYYLK